MPYNNVFEWLHFYIFTCLFTVKRFLFFTVKSQTLGPRWCEDRTSSGSGRAGQFLNPNPSSTGTSYGHVPGVKVVSRYAAVGRAAALSRKGKPSQKLPLAPALIR